MMKKLFFITDHNKVQFFFVSLLKFSKYVIFVVIHSVIKRVLFFNSTTIGPLCFNDK